jgi:ribonuclease T2
MSWEPAFCEGRPKVSECRSQTAASPSARQFSLHGLWPQPRSNSYCGVSAADRATDDAKRWRDLPEVRLSSATRAALDAVMPGTQSALERHEWIVHGTCYGAPQERYFSDAIAAIGAVNASPVAALFAANIGKRLTLEQIRGAFDTAFGRGAGDRIRLACDDDGGRRIIAEITIGLADKVPDAGAFAPALRNASPTDGGCDGGIVDPAGLQ